MIKIVQKIILACLFLYLPFNSGAWSLLGHRIVGEIAESYLSPAAKKEVSLLLGTQSPAMASNWADFIKADSTMSYLSPWHYVNFKGGLNHSDFLEILKNDTATDAYTKLNFIIKQLKDKKTERNEKAFYLKMLIHIVGDLHQPLHAGRPGDQGGNKIKVLWMNVPYNLHQVWDAQLIELQELSYTEYTAAINHTTKTQRVEWQRQTLNDWLWDSYQLAEKIYADVKQPDEKLGYPYNYKYIGLLEQQLVKGGVHLAGLLNEIFAVKKK